MSVHAWMDKEIVVCIQNEILFHLKKGDSAIETTWMNLGDNMLTVISQTEKETAYLTYIGI